MPVDPTIAQQLATLTQAIDDAETAYSAASDANNQAQASAQAAVANAAGTLAAQTSAHGDLDTAIQALITYVQTLQ